MNMLDGNKIFRGAFTWKFSNLSAIEGSANFLDATKGIFSI
jgi:hypothetical protein